MFSFTLALGLAHALYLYTNGGLSLGQVITFMGFLGMLRFPTFVSIFAFSLVKLGAAGADRILAILNAETEIDENRAGIERRIEGEVVFDNVSFSYHDSNVLKGISFKARPGETVAIVGQTGSGKSTLTRLINRIYEVSDGRVLIDGVDVRVWSMESLRSQVATIDQDVFLFSRTLAENIAFGVRHPVSRAEIEAVAKQAQAHDFIMSFTDGYDTMVGERGVTLSGGQRQRIAIARAFLADPRILVLDDSTSAIDSATEDQIQRALRNILHGRTTFIITHRLFANSVGRSNSRAARRRTGGPRHARGIECAQSSLPTDLFPSGRTLCRRVACHPRWRLVDCGNFSMQNRILAMKRGGFPIRQSRESDCPSVLGPVHGVRSGGQAPALPSNCSSATWVSLPKACRGNLLESVGEGAAQHEWFLVRLAQVTKCCTCLLGSPLRARNPARKGPLMGFVMDGPGCGRVRSRV